MSLFPSGSSDRTYMPWNRRLNSIAYFVLREDRDRARKDVRDFFPTLAVRLPPTYHKSFLLVVCPRGRQHRVSSHTCAQTMQRRSDGGGQDEHFYRRQKLETDLNLCDENNRRNEKEFLVYLKIIIFFLSNKYIFF